MQKNYIISKDLKVTIWRLYKAKRKRVRSHAWIGKNLINKKYWRKRIIKKNKNLGR